MGTGFHGVNGISPSYTINIYRTYVLPRLTFGLEAVVLKEKQIQSLESYHRTTLRELQSLPKRTAKYAVYLLAGQLEGLLDIQIASLLHMAGDQRNTILFEIGMYQAAKHKKHKINILVYLRCQAPSTLQPGRNRDSRENWTPVIQDHHHKLLDKPHEGGNCHKIQSTIPPA